MKHHTSLYSKDNEPDILEDTTNCEQETKDRCVIYLPSQGKLKKNGTNKWLN